MESAKAFSLKDQANETEIKKNIKPMLVQVVKFFNRIVWNQV